MDFLSSGLDIWIFRICYWIFKVMAILLFFLQGYGHVFIQKIQQKHVLARNYFSRLPGMAELIKEKANERDMRSGPSIHGQAVSVQ